MEQFFAWTLPVIAIAILVCIVAKFRSHIGRAIAVYVAFSVVFGCIHFLYYRYSPASYVVSKDVPIPATALAAVDIQKQLEVDLGKIAILDAAILQMTGRPAIHLGPLVFDDQTRHYPLRYPTVDVDTWVTTRWVGPKRDDPTYSAKAKLSFTNDYRGIKTGSVATLLIATPSDPTLRLEEVQFARRIVEIRGNFAEDVNKLFQPGTATPILFSLLDFFYFSFSMLGVGEIIAAKQPVRLLALVQIFCTLVIPLALGSTGSKKHD